jgi:hypothetical protein
LPLGALDRLSDISTIFLTTRGVIVVKIPRPLICPKNTNKAMKERARNLKISQGTSPLKNCEAQQEQNRLSVSLPLLKTGNVD